jgi:hypothetical protein
VVPCTYQRVFEVVRVPRLFKDHPAFTSNVKQRHHFIHKLHLLVALEYFRSQGNAASAFHIKDGFDVGMGSFLNYVNRAVAAINSFGKRSILWPNPAEHVEISVQI